VQRGSRGDQRVWPAKTGGLGSANDPAQVAPAASGPAPSRLDHRRGQIHRVNVVDARRQRPGERPLPRPDVQHGAGPVGDEPAQQVEDLVRVRWPVLVGIRDARMTEDRRESFAFCSGRHRPTVISVPGYSVVRRRNSQAANGAATARMNADHATPASTGCCIGHALIVADGLGFPQS
jgi:hypothetical protein